MADMHIQQVVLREIQLPLIAPFITSFESFTHRRIILVQVFDDHGMTGWGECVATEEPLYNHEFIDGAWLLLRDYLIPQLFNMDMESPAAIADKFAPIRGNRMARAAIEAACWDLYAKREQKPLWQILGGTRTEIDCGVSIGIQPSLSEMVEKIERELADGYRRIKLKIKPGLDIQIAGTARERFPDTPIMLDANSAYTLADKGVLKELDRFDLMMIEQPLADDDLIDHATLQKQIKTPICLDESIHSVEFARQAHEIDACKIINIKLGRVGGHTEARRIHDYCLGKSIPVWCGGMLETGIGRAHNIALSTLQGFCLPGDVSASKRYWKQDIIEPEVTIDQNGRIKAQVGIGIGYEVNLKLIDKLTLRKEVVKAQF